MDLINIIILGIIQGVTEFLPVSSSGHLVLAHHFTNLKTESNMVLDVVLHLGTLFAVLYVYRRDILSLCTGVLRGRRADLTYIGYMAVASVPVGIVGIMWGDYIESAFEKPFVVSIALLATAGILLASSRAHQKGRGELSLKRALIIGLAQAVAPLPGISRSGTTIATALLLGIHRREAGRFSFMIFLPAISGATLLKLRDIQSIDLPPGLVATGFFVSLITGLFALTILLKFVNRGKLHLFAPYCAGLSVVSFVLIYVFHL
ncbi:MAG: undecaprenyl-diphosphate phosphatase [Fibrobacterota bacterium]